MGHEVTAVVALRRGTQAHVLRMDVRSDTAFVLKAFDPRYRHATREAFLAEVDALRAFSSSATVGVVPTVVAADEARLCYVMTHVPGVPLEAADSRVVNAACRAAIATLIEYHDVVGDVYGDFQPANVLVDANGAVALIDPTAANPYFRSFLAMGHTAIATDVGYWLASCTALRSLRAFRRARLATAMVLAARNTPGWSSDTERSAFTVAREHLATAMHTPRSRPRLLASAAVLRIVEWRLSRRRRDGAVSCVGM